MDCETVLLKDLNFNIPPIQRGLVWEPVQVINLWDSICKGYPIGAFMASPDANGRNLLDGQQRYNAICIGLGREMEKIAEASGKSKPEPQAQLWVRLVGEEPDFMVCTICHPWGFKKDNQGNLERLDYDVQDKANQTFLQEMCNEEPKLKNLFVKAPLKNGYPWLSLTDGGQRQEVYVPMPLLLSFGDDKTKTADKVLETWKKNELYKGGWEILRKRGVSDNELRQQIGAMLDSRWLNRIRETSVPVIEWDPKGRNLQELFQRINTGGTKIATRDLNYSSLCAYCSDECLDEKCVNLKAEHEALSHDFLPPEHLAELAARLVQLEGEGEKIADWQKTYADVGRIRTWFTSDRGKPNRLGYRFLELYKGEFQSVIELFKTWFRGGVQESKVELPDDRLPSTLFLFQDKHWLFVCIWMMMHFPAVFSLQNEKEADRYDATKRYFPLLCMLPQMMVGDSNPVAFENFAKSFYEGLREIRNEDKERLSLLELMAIGCAQASLQPMCCMYPYPMSEDENDETEWIKKLCAQAPVSEKGTASFSSRWRFIFSKYGYHSQDRNLFLHYYQRVYVNYMLKQSKFMPGMRAHWEKAYNRPWDHDHIIPKSWNKKDPRLDSLGNMQLLDFRANREKGNSDVNPKPKTMTDELHREFSKVCLRVWNGCDGEASIGDHMSIRTLDAGTVESKLARFFEETEKKDGYDAGISRRADYIMAVLLRELHVFELIKCINQVPDILACLGAASHPLKRVVLRYHMTQLLWKKLKSSSYDVRWAVSEYVWNRIGSGMKEPRIIPMYEHVNVELSFYHSLSYWLYVGVPAAYSNAPAGFHYVCALVSGSSDDYSLQYGALRGLNITDDEWNAHYKKNEASHDAWWDFSVAQAGHSNYAAMIDEKDYSAEKTAEMLYQKLSDILECQQKDS